MTKGELIQALQSMENVPDDAIIITESAGMETGTILETLLRVPDQEQYYKEDTKNCVDAFDGTRFTIKHWVPCDKNCVGATRVLRVG